MPVNTIEIPLHKGQRDFIANRSRFNQLNCGRRFGKTTLRSFLIPEAVLQIQVPTAYLAPNYPSMQEVWEEDKQLLARYIDRKDEQNYTLWLKGGQWVRYWSAEKYENLRGKKYGRVIWDELCHKDTVGQIKLIYDSVVRGTMTDLKGDFYALSTPKGITNAWYTDFYKKAKANLRGWSYHHYTTYDNPFIDRQELEDIKADTPAIIWQQEYLAEFIDIAGSLIKREYLKYTDRLPREDYVRVGIGVDLAITTKTSSDYTALVAVGKTKAGDFHVLDVHRFQSASEIVIANAIVTFAKKWEADAVAIEKVSFQSVIVGMVRRASNFSVIGVKPVKDKLTRAFPLISRYEQGLIYHSDKLPEYYESELLSFAPPFKDHDDLVDATVYAWNAASKEPFQIISI